MVTTVYSHAEGSSGGRGGGEPQVSGPVRIYTAAGRRDLFIPVSGAAVDSADYERGARGDGQDRAGVSAAGDASARAVGAERALAGDGREHVSPERPQGRGPVPGHDA